MAKFHMKANGQPGACTASVKACPLGEDAIHGSSPEQVRERFEAAMKQHVMPTAAKKPRAAKKASAAPQKPQRAPVKDALLTQDPYAGNTWAKPEPYWDWDADQQGCARELDGEQCGDAYCHHGTYRGIRLAADVNARKQIAESLGEDQLPVEIADVISGRSPEEMFVVERTESYYSDEINVRLRKDVQAAVDEFHYSRPNVASRDGSLEFARMNGVDTSGKTEMEAIKTLVDHRFSKEFQAKVDRANSMAKAKIDLSKVSLSKQKLAAATAAPVRTGKDLPENIAGVIYRHEDGELTLVSGDYSRFKAMHGNRKTAEFFVLSREEPATGWRARGPEKEPLGAPREDVSSW